MSDRGVGIGEREGGGGAGPTKSGRHRVYNARCPFMRNTLNNDKIKLCYLNILNLI